MNKQQLAAKIWETANKMRSKIEANEYKDYILGFIFYKFLSEKEVKYLKENAWTEEYMIHLNEDNGKVVENLQNNIGYFISYDNLFSTWIKKDKDFGVKDVRDALSAFSRLISQNHRGVFDNIFNTLETGLSKLGDTAASQTKAIKSLIDTIDTIPMDGTQDYDVLGFIYEYLISMFAANAGKKAGEFYTPHEVSLLMSEIIANHLKDKKEIKIYDPTSGSGSLLINIGKCVSKYTVSKNNIKYYAQELKQNTYNLTRMNLVMRGIIPDNINVNNADTLEEDWPLVEGEENEPLRVDAVVSNPPYSQSWDPSDKEMDSRFSQFGLAPKAKADYAFLLHDLHHINEDGIMTIVLPHGVLFRGGEEGNIRRNLVEGDYIDAVIGLPANIFFGTGIPTIIMVLKQKRDLSDILFVDASKYFIKVGKNNKLRSSDIKRIVDAIIERKDIDKYARVVRKDEIRLNDYNLNIPRYVDTSAESESWDIYSMMYGGIPKSEIELLQKYWEAFPSLKEELFESVSAHSCELKCNEIAKVIQNNQNVLNFKKSFDGSFVNFSDYLTDILIGKMMDIKPIQTESVVANEMFNRLNNIPLVDKYVAYQILDDIWVKIAIDLEMIQTEGYECIRQVDPIIVIKKKNNKEEEVQDGWCGHIIPFDLVKQTYLLSDCKELKRKEHRVEEIHSLLEEILDSLTEEEKASSFVNEACDAFVIKELKKALKEKVLDVELEQKLNRVLKLSTEESSLKKDIKASGIEMERKVKETIESLSPNQMNELLVMKWIHPLVEQLKKLPLNVINELISKVDYLAKKYTETFEDIYHEISETEKSLSSLMNDLEGDEFDMLGIKELKNLLGG